MIIIENVRVYKETYIFCYVFGNIFITGFAGFKIEKRVTSFVVENTKNSKIDSANHFSQKANIKILVMGLSFYFK